MQIDPQIIQWAGIFLLGFLLASLIFILVGRLLFSYKLKKQLEFRKDQLIALTSHYLLNPVTVIQTALAQLEEQDQTLKVQDRRRLYDAIQRGQQRLWILAEQFIIVGEIDEGELVLKPEVSDFQEVVSDAMAAVDPFARAKNLTFKLEDKLEADRQVRIDPKRMKQAVIALLDNAVKFSPDNSQVTVQIVAGDKMHSVIVQDQGIGMSEEIIAHLSDRFSRGSSVYNFDYEGVGLGLHIAQAIARLHNGNLGFESIPKRGTVAYIQFPSQ